MRLAFPDLGGEDGKVEALRQPHLLEVALQKPPGVERVGDEPELEAARAEGLEQRVRVRRELPRRIPGRVLGLDEARQLRVVDLDLEVPEQLADEPRVLELLDGARCPEERLVAL